jgi:hypothetical protein
LNEKQCSISYAPLACGSVYSAPDVFIKLDEPTLLTLHNLTGRYVYWLNGLTVVDQYNNMISHPCTPELRSRWLLKDITLCNATDLFNTTNLTLSYLLKRSTDTNPYFRDITFPQSATCAPLDTDPAIELAVDGKCWTRVRDLPDNMGTNRKFVCSTLVLNATDQFHQRRAWALAQILVLVKSAIGHEDQETEWFLNYDDIFVRNAFGNYRDILRESSYNSLMAENLSYLGNKSAAYVLENYRYVAFADENFAREVMQLFTIGIIKLNPEGTLKLDSQ